MMLDNDLFSEFHRTSWNFAFREKVRNFVEVCNGYDEADSYDFDISIPASTQNIEHRHVDPSLTREGSGGDAQTFPSFHISMSIWGRMSTQKEKPVTVGKLFNCSMGSM